MAKGWSRSPTAGGTWRTMRSKSGAMSVRGASSEVAAQPSLEDANRVGKSSWSSLAPRIANRSKTMSWTSCGLASGRSTLLITTIGRRPRASALDSTNLVCGFDPSAASTSTTTPSTMLRMRSTWAMMARLRRLMTKGLPSAEPGADQVAQRGFRAGAEMLQHLGRRQTGNPAAAGEVVAAAIAVEEAGGVLVAGAGGVDQAVDR